MLYKIPYYSLLIGTLIITSCQKSNDYQDISAYYFPIETLEDGLIYEYESTNDSVPTDIWFYKSLINDSASYLITTGYDLSGNPVQLTQEEIVDNGSILNQLRLMNYDSTGKGDIEEAEVLQKSVFPFQVKDSLGTFIFKIKFQEPSIDNQTVTLLRNRTFKGMTAYEWQGEVLDCVEFDVLERISIIYDGSEVQQNAYKKELYAKDIGLIYYSKTTEDGFFREYILKDRYPMEKVFEKFK